MLTHFAIGPTDQQTYGVAYYVPGTKVATIVYEHLNEATAIEEAARLNREQAKQTHDKRVQRDLDRRALDKRARQRLEWED